MQASVLPSDEQKTTRVVRHLRRAALLGGLDDEALARVASLARPLAYQRGAQLNEPARAAGSIYLIVEGRLRVYQQSLAGREVTLDLIGAGEAFRFLAREPDGAPTSVAEVLVQRTELYRFPGPAPLEALAAHPKAARRLAAECERTLAQAHAALAEVVLYDVETRLARLLVRLAGGGRGRQRQGPGLRGRDARGVGVAGQRQPGGRLSPRAPLRLSEADRDGVAPPRHRGAAGPRGPRPLPGLPPARRASHPQAVAVAVFACAAQRATAR